MLPLACLGLLFAGRTLAQAERVLPGFTYRGCADVKSASYAKDIPFSTLSGSCSPEECQRMCAGHHYAAVFSTHCRCANEGAFEYTIVAEAQCDNLCVADQPGAGVCGSCVAETRANVYSCQTPAAATPAPPPAEIPVPGPLTTSATSSSVSVSTSLSVVVVTSSFVVTSTPIVTSTPEVVETIIIETSSTPIVVSLSTTLTVAGGCPVVSSNIPAPASQLPNPPCVSEGPFGIPSSSSSSSVSGYTQTVIVEPGRTDTFTATLTATFTSTSTSVTTQTSVTTHAPQTFVPSPLPGPATANPGYTSTIGGHGSEHGGVSGSSTSTTTLTRSGFSTSTMSGGSASGTWPPDSDAGVSRLEGGLFCALVAAVLVAV